MSYHVHCKATFLSPKSIKGVVCQSSGTELHHDTAFDSVVKYLAENKGSIHDSIDVYTKYEKAGGHVLSRRLLISKVVEKFGGDMITLSSPGYLLLLAFKSSATKAFHVIPDDTDDMSEAIEKVAKKIKAEIDSIETDRKNYHCHIDNDICSKFQSNTLYDVLSRVSQKLQQSLPALLVGNIITSVVKNLATPLQIALAVLLRNLKELVKAFFDFGVGYSYHELLRFKKSNNNVDLTGLTKEVDSLIQGVGDNFDQEISSQNGKLQTHSMALLMTQSDDKQSQDNMEELYSRLALSDMAK